MNELKTKLISKYFPDRVWIDDSVVGMSVDRAFKMAWDLGHAYGEDEVESYFMDLVEIIKPLTN